MLSIHYKSQTQPVKDWGKRVCPVMEASWSATETRAVGENERSEWQRRSGMASRGSICPGEKATLPRQSTANAWGDVQKPSQAGLVGRVRNTGQSPLSIISQAGILGARVQKDTCLPREGCRVSARTDRTVRGDHHVAEISRGHISRRKRAPQRGEDSPR